MKNEEAIRRIKEFGLYHAIGDLPHSAKTVEAFNMAIEALSANAVHGEWIYLHGSIGSYMTISCPFCGTTFNDVAEWKYNYCPSCGKRVKGSDSK